MARRKRTKKNKVAFNFNKRRFIYAAGAICFLSLLIFFGTPVVQKVETFKVRPADIKTNVRLNKTVTEHILTNNIFTIDLTFIADVIMEGNPEYKTVRLKKKFPRELIIEVDHRGAVAQIKGRYYYPVDRDGIVLADGSSQALDKLIPIEYDDNTRIFSKGHSLGDKRLRRALALVDLIEREDTFSPFVVSLINTVNSQGGYFLIQSKEAGKISAADAKVIQVIVGEDNYAKKIETFKSLIKGELRDKISVVKYIDLRHKKVYVGFRR